MMWIISGRIPLKLVEPLRRMTLAVVLSTLLLGFTARDWTSWNADTRFLLWLVAGYALESVVGSYGDGVLPTYWYQALRALGTLSLFVGRELPTCLRSNDVLAIGRAIHVGLLTSRAGYGTDVSLFKKDVALTWLLVLAGVLVDLTCTFVVLRAFGWSTLSALIVAVLAPAPTAEVAEPMFRLVSSTCSQIIEATPKHVEAGISGVSGGGSGAAAGGGGKGDDGVSGRGGNAGGCGGVVVVDDAASPTTKPLIDLQHELARLKRVFKCTALPTTVISIVLFSSMTSAVTFRATADDTDLDADPDSAGWVQPVDPHLVINSTLRLDVHVLPAQQMLLSGALGVAATAVYVLAVYALGRLCRPERLASDAKALLVFAVATFSMYQVGAVFGVAAALGAIGGSLTLRHVVGFNPPTAALLARVWPHTSALYYMCFAFMSVNFVYSAATGDDASSLLETAWQIGVVSLAAFAVKVVAVAAICRCFAISWLSGVLLGVALSSKGTVQAALSTTMPLKVATLAIPGSFVAYAMTLQLYVLMNFVVVSPCTYVVTRIIVYIIRK